MMGHPPAAQPKYERQHRPCDDGNCKRWGVVPTTQKSPRTKCKDDVTAELPVLFKSDMQSLFPRVIKRGMKTMTQGQTGHKVRKSVNKRTGDSQPLCRRRAIPVYLEKIFHELADYPAIVLFPNSLSSGMRATMKKLGIVARMTQVKKWG